MPNYYHTCLPSPFYGPVAYFQSFVRRDLSEFVAQGRLLWLPRAAF